MNDRVIPFNSFEEAMETMADYEAKARSLIVAKQETITYGSYWLRPVPEEGLFVFGRVFTRQEVIEKESRASLTAVEERRARGYVYGVAHNVYCPAGELGDSHISVLWPIEEAEYEAAQGNNWRLTFAPWETEMLQRVQREIEEARHPNPPSPQEES